MTFLAHFPSHTSISNRFLFFISLFWLSCCFVLSRFRSSNQDKLFNFSLRTSWARRNALGPLKYVPEAQLALIENYTAWLWEKKLKPATVRDQLAALASFWT